MISTSFSALSSSVRRHINCKPIGAPWKAALSSNQTDLVFQQMDGRRQRTQFVYRFIFLAQGSNWAWRRIKIFIDKSGGKGNGRKIQEVDNGAVP